VKLGAVSEQNELKTSLRMQNYDFVVVGGSLPGMVSALLIKKAHPTASVVIIESAEQLGGNLIGHKAFGEHFDAGTHILQEIGDTEIDGLIEQSVHHQDLVKLESSIGDYAATISEKRVWAHTAYPDVLQRSPFIANKIMGEIIEARKRSNELDLVSGSRDFSSRRLSAKDASMIRFGATATNEIVMPILNGVFGNNHELSGFAIEFCNLMRLCLVGKDEWERKVISEGLQDRVAFPDQQNLPIKQKHHRKSLYSRKNGASDFVRGLANQCSRAGIHSLTSTKVMRINPHSKSLTVIGKPNYSGINYGQIVSCVGVAFTETLITGNPINSKKMLAYRIMHFLLSEPLKSQICYFYSQHAGSVMFRVTNYSAFSGRNSDYRLTVETIGNEHLSDEELLVAVEKELIEVDIIDSGMVRNSICMRGKNVFPQPSPETFEQFSISESYVKEFEGSGLITSGLGAANGIFFQNEILHHIVSQIRTNF
jgi:protoporphyrinogen oxidase